MMQLCISFVGGSSVSKVQGERFVRQVTVVVSTTCIGQQGMSGETKSM